MIRCIDCDYLFSCDKADENKKECEYFVKEERTITHLESKEGNKFNFKKILGA